MRFGLLVGKFTVPVDFDAPLPAAVLASFVVAGLGGLAPDIQLVTRRRPAAEASPSAGSHSYNRSRNFAPSSSMS